MSKFMSPNAALSRVVEDNEAPTALRCEALQQIARPTLALLRRILVDTETRTKPVPSRLKAIAALIYAREIQLRKSRPGRTRKTQDAESNALGIS